MLGDIDGENPFKIQLTPSLVSLGHRLLVTLSLPAVSWQLPWKKSSIL